MPPFKVHTYHVNIDIGDCMIHLLVDTATAPPTITRAVLIDGGFPGPTFQQIVRVINYIQTPGRYLFDNTQHFGPGLGNLRFDSIVITHWDKDHFGGVRDLILDGYKLDVAAHAEITAALAQGVTNFAAAPPPPRRRWTPMLLNALDPIQQLETQTTFQCRYLKYAQVQPVPAFRRRTVPPTPLNTVAQFTPLTTRYVPYQYSTRFDTRNPLGVKISDGIGPTTMKVERSVVFRCNKDLPYSPTIQNSLDVLLNFKYSRSWPTPGRPSPVKKEFRFIRACNLVAHYEGYLGAELLENRLLPVAARTLIVNPRELLVRQQILPAHGPRIFIVAGCQVLIDRARPAATASVAHAPNPLSRRVVFREGQRKTVDNPVARPVTLDAFGHALIPDDTKRWGSIPMNSASICCVILTATATSFKLKHYFAGDALWDMEAAVAAWLTPPLPAPPTDYPLKIPFMKLSQ
jgi:hypothetical protein